MRLVLIWVFSLWAGIVSAHEVMPTIGDLTVTGGELRLELALNAEAFATGVDLDAIEDINATDRSDVFDRLRALEPGELATEMKPVAEEMARRIDIRAGNLRLELKVAEIRIGETGNVELPRESLLVLRGELPDGRAPIVLTWPKGYGALILRQMGVEAGYTGMIEGGGSSGEILRGGAAPQSGWAVLVNYVPVGFAKIIPQGPEHILMMLGLFFFGTRRKALVWQVAMFAAALPVGLVLGTTGSVTIPATGLAALIGASIVIVAVGNILSQALNAARLFLVSGAGLVHGVGLAAALGSYGLPEGHGLIAVTGFALGAGLALLAVVAAAFLAVGLWFWTKRFYRAYIAIPASAVIAVIGVWLCVGPLLF